MEEVELREVILAAVTLEPGLVGGGVPVFVVRTREEQERLSLFLSRILKAMAHDLENGVFIIVKH